MKLLIHDLNTREWEQVAKEYEGWTVICSLRGGRSNTGIFLKQLEDELGCPVEKYSLSLDNDSTEITEAIRRAGKPRTCMPTPIPSHDGSIF